jgi:hypothetical protein
MVHAGAEFAERIADALECRAHLLFECDTAFVRRSWSFEVVDLDRVPREYMSLDVTVVREAITRDGVCDIPGLRIFQAEALRVRCA